jgi:hypothetical protein
MITEYRIEDIRINKASDAETLASVLITNGYTVTIKPAADAASYFYLVTISIQEENDGSIEG